MGHLLKLVTLLLIPSLYSAECSYLPNDAQDLSQMSQLTPADERMLKPPTFPHGGPFGWFSSGLLCKWFLKKGLDVGRGCDGPAPPFTTTQTPPKQRIIIYSESYYHAPHLNYDHSHDEYLEDDYDDESDEEKNDEEQEIQDSYDEQENKYEGSSDQGDKNKSYRYQRDEDYKDEGDSAAVYKDDANC